jgi:hypothetical protein
MIFFLTANKNKTKNYIIPLFNVGNVLLYAIYQLNLTVFMYVTRISRFMQRSVLFAVSHNREYGGTTVYSNCVF